MRHEPPGAGAGIAQARGGGNSCIARASASIAAALLLVASTGCGCKGSKSSPEVEGGCAYTETPGRCELQSTEVGTANSNDTTLVEVKLVYKWTGALPQRMHDPTRIVTWDIPRTRLESARAHAAAHASVTCKFAVSTGGCPPYLELDAAATAPPPAPAGDRR